MLCEETRIKQSLSVHIGFFTTANSLYGNIFGNKWGRYNEGSLYANWSVKISNVVIMSNLSDTRNRCLVLYEFDASKARSTIKLSRCSIEPGSSIPYKTAYAPSEDADQPAHPHRMIKVFAVRLKTPWIFGYPQMALFKD